MHPWQNLTTVTRVLRSLFELYCFFREVIYVQFSRLVNAAVHEYA